MGIFFDEMGILEYMRPWFLMQPGDEGEEGEEVANGKP